MKEKFFLRGRVLLILSLISILLFTVACNEDPIAPQETHLKAIGMVFYTSGIEVARIMKGATNDTLSAPTNGLSDHYDIQFIDEDEKIIPPPSSATKTLAWEFDDNSIADVWQHADEQGAFEFHLKGLQTGETNVEFFVMHNDHSDFRSGKIPVKIEDKSGTTGVPIGLELNDEESGNILISINKTQVVGQLSVNNSDTTNHLIVNFFDSKNNHFQPSVPPHALLVEVTDTNIVGITGLEVSEPWAFKLIGLNTGSTTITIKILHNGNVGVTFEPITVNVK